MLEPLDEAVAHDAQEEVPESRERHMPTMRLFSWLILVTLVVGYLGFSMLDLSVATKEIGRALFHTAMSILVIPTLLYTAVWVDRKERWIWMGMGVALALWVAGDAYVAYYQTIAKVPLSRPSLADVSYVISYGFLMAMTYALARYLGAFDVARKDLIKVVLAWLALLAIAGGLIWYALVQPLYGLAVPVSDGQRALDSLYPVLDAVVITGILSVLIGRRVTRWHPWIVLLLAGLVMTASADLCYNFFAVAGTYSVDNTAANVLYSVWLSAYGLYLIAAVNRLTWRPGASDI